jgi:hypothetical protein
MKLVFRGRLILTSAPDQDRYVMITIAVLQRRTDNPAQRRLQTGADHARADAPSRQLERFPRRLNRGFP